MSSTPLISHLEFEKAVAANVRARAAARQIPQSQLAEILGLGQAAISRRMRGESPWQLRELSQIAPVLGCSPSDLTRVEA